MNNATDTNPKLAAATGLYMEGIRDGKPEEALDKYTGHRYTQHSTGVGDGKAGFMAFFKPFLERNPDRNIKVIRSIVDGPYVFCHVFQSLNQGESEWVTMDMFDTSDDDRIIEHWDVIAPYQADTVSGNDMVGGSVEIDDLALTETNKTLIKEFSKQVLIERQYDKATVFIAEDFTQHDPALDNGVMAFQSALEQGTVGQYDMLFKVIGQGNFVVTYASVFETGHSHAVFDVYRIADQKIVEHWKLAEQILPRDQWGNSGKF